MGEMSVHDTTNTVTTLALRDIGLGYRPSDKSLVVNYERVVTGIRNNANTALPYKIMTITQSDYLALETKNANTLYFII